MSKINNARPNLVSKSCDLKLNQKVFYLQFDRAASCCRAQQHDLKSLSFSSLMQLWQTEKTQLDQGHEIPGCDYCWRNERQGISSYRQINHGVDLNVIELFIDNLCNHMCSYCSPKFSSVWQHTIQTQGMFAKISTTNQTNLVPVIGTDSIEWLNHIRDYIHQQPDDSVVLKLLGGEPLMQIRNIQMLLDMDSRKIRQLRLVTNLNPPNNRFLLWLLDHVPTHKLQLDISLDASPGYNHVPRSGFDADRFMANLDLMRSHNISQLIMSVVSVLSVFDLPQFVAWLDEQGITNHFYPLYNPDCLDAGLLPQWIRQTIWDQIPQAHSNTVLRDVLYSQKPPVDIKRFEQYSYLSQYFDRTQQDPLLINNELFQEYWTWLERTYRK